MSVIYLILELLKAARAVSSDSLRLAHSASAAAFESTETALLL